ncbi:MAG TPA: 3-dehydroquinate synthase [Thermomicrobiales bacterium]|nr:3-dehydroquinate synthase [Thermomicrobiales bacterium]
MSESRLPERVVLIGPSGSGKSELARQLADGLGYVAVDTDAEIVERIRMPIAEFFTRFGDAAFRAIEAQAVTDACRRSMVVIATGGGAVLSPANWAAWRPGSVVVALTARAETLVERVRRQAADSGELAERPLLAGDAEARMRSMLVSRGPLYASADITVDTDGVDAARVCESVLSFVGSAVANAFVPSLSLATSGERSDIYVGSGLAEHAGEIAARRWPKARRAWLISDENVSSFWGDWLMASLVESGIVVTSLTVAAGERSKDLRVVERLCSEMTTGGVTRRDLVVALGGGVVGDLAGFVASICLRGLSLMQVPTSLLAMVDSSVGGKTGVNLPAGKNLVGAFYQPGVVVVDPSLLDTLPADEYRSGMAEIIKHSLIQPATPLGGRELFELLSSAALDPLPREVMAGVLLRNVAIKHSVVQADERESGLRMILNFGHTAGHAIEADGYRYRHGEAVALGILVASRVAQRLERVGDEYVANVEALIERAALPTRLDGSAEAVIGRLSHDKKNVDGALHWILPRSDGIVEPVTGVPLDVVRAALMDTGAS